MNEWVEMDFNANLSFKQQCLLGAHGAVECQLLCKARRYSRRASQAIWGATCCCCCKEVAAVPECCNAPFGLHKEKEVRWHLTRCVDENTIQRDAVECNWHRMFMDDENKKFDEGHQQILEQP